MPKMTTNNFSIENILSAAKSFSPTTTAMMLNAQQAFNMAFGGMSGFPMDFFNPYGFPATSSQGPVPFPPAQFPIFCKFLATVYLTED